MGSLPLYPDGVEVNTVCGNKFNGFSSVGLHSHHDTHAVQFAKDSNMNSFAPTLRKPVLGNERCQVHVGFPQEIGRGMLGIDRFQTGEKVANLLSNQLYIVLRYKVMQRLIQAAHGFFDSLFIRVLEHYVLNEALTPVFDAMASGASYVDNKMFELKMKMKSKPKPKPKPTKKPSDVQQPRKR